MPPAMEEGSSDAPCAGAGGGAPGEEGAANAPPAETTTAPSSQLKPGERVEVVGLTSEGGRPHNGKVGVVLSFVEDSGRFKIELGPDSCLALKPENLRRQAADADIPAAPGDGDTAAAPEAAAAPTADTTAPPGAAEAAAEGGSEAQGEQGAAEEQQEKAAANDGGSQQLGDFAVGDRVEVLGLSSEAGQRLNGRAGSVAEVLADKGRLKIQLAAEEFVALKPDNLRRVAGAGELIVGDRVEITGLESESGSKLNGTVGKIVAHDAEKGRFNVEVGMQQKLSVKPVNLKQRSPSPPDASRKRPASRSSSSSSSSSSSARPRKEAKKTLSPEEQLEKILRGERREAREATKAARAEGAKAAEAAAAAMREAAAAAAAKAAAPERSMSPGDHVEVFGLQSEAGRKLNGKNGVITKFEPEKGRFQVDLGQAAVQSLKPENLRPFSKSASVIDDYRGSTAGYTLL